MAAATGWSPSAVGRVGEQAPAPAAGAPVVQLDVAAAVQRRAQGGDERQLVGRVGGGPQRQHQVADLRGHVDDGGVLGPVRHAEAGERRLEHRQRRAGREQDGDVAGPARAQPAVAVADGPPLAQGGGHGGGHRLGLPLAQHLGVDVVVVVDVGAEHVHRAVVARVRAGRRRAGRTPAARRGSGWMTSPNTPLTQSMTAVVERKLADSTSRVGADLVGGGEVHGDVGPAEAVDRLLRVADDEQPAGQRAQRRSGRAAGRPGAAVSRTAISSWIGSVSWNSSSSTRR